MFFINPELKFMTWNSVVAIAAVYLKTEYKDHKVQNVPDRLLLYLFET